jgi:uncharacterized Zn-binding protein involved in type VI secretion
MESKFGFTPHASVNGCLKCPLRGDCDHEISVPDKEIVIIDGIFE